MACGCGHLAYVGCVRSLCVVSGVSAVLCGAGQIVV